MPGSGFTCPSPQVVDHICRIPGRYRAILALDDFREDDHPEVSFPRKTGTTSALTHRASSEDLVRMQDRRHNRGRAVPSRLAALAGLLALVSVGCGQLGGVHGNATTTTVVPAAFDAGSTSGVLTGTGQADSGGTVDIRGAQGPPISGDMGTLPG